MERHVSSCEQSLPLKSEVGRQGYFILNTSVLKIFFQRAIVHLQLDKIKKLIAVEEGCNQQAGFGEEESNKIKWLIGREAGEEGGSWKRGEQRVKDSLRRLKSEIQSREKDSDQTPSCCKLPELLARKDR